MKLEAIATLHNSPRITALLHAYISRKRVLRCVFDGTPNQRTVGLPITLPRLDAHGTAVSRRVPVLQKPLSLYPSNIIVASRLLQAISHQSQQTPSVGET